MSTRVVTISTCDRCGWEVKSENYIPLNTEFSSDHAPFVPNAWRVVLGHLLCPACVRDIESVLNDKPGAWPTTAPSGSRTGAMWVSTGSEEGEHERTPEGSTTRNGDAWE